MCKMHGFRQSKFKSTIISLEAVKGSNSPTLIVVLKNNIDIWNMGKLKEW